MGGVFGPSRGILWRSTREADATRKRFLRVWTRDYITTPSTLRSELDFAISRMFKEHGIEIPFPQRDLHIRSGVLSIKTTAES